MQKRPICFPRLRKVPKQCSWVDQRLVRDGHSDPRSQEACPRSLFLVTVADAHGLSVSSDRSICRRVSRAHLALPKARQALIRLGLVADDPPLSQGFALDAPAGVPVPQTPSMSTADQPMALKDIVQPMAETLS